MSNIVDHKDHTWEYREPCVYCKDCNFRLYHGRLPRTDLEKAEMIKTFEGLINSIPSLELNKPRSKNYGSLGRYV